MKLIYLLLALACAGCAKSSGSDLSSPCSELNVAGTWVAKWSYLLLSSNCTGSETTCNSRFTYNTTDEGDVLVSVSETNGSAGCMPVGEHTCTFSRSGNELTIDCGDGAISYTKRL